MLKTRYMANVVVAVVFSIALVICTVVVTRALVRIKNRDETIRITGSARQLIRSDFIVWKAQITSRAPEMAPAYRNLKAGVDRAKAYFISKGIGKDELLDTPITTQTLYAPLPKETQQGSSNVFRKIEAYELAQEIEIRSAKVDIVDTLSRKATELLSSGIVFESLPPKYHYTKLSDLKVSILAEAAKDARARAEQIATNSGCRVGDVRFARMGVLRITPAYTTTEVNEMGTYDTTSLDKEITATVTMGFSIR